MTRQLLQGNSIKIKKNSKKFQSHSISRTCGGVNMDISEADGILENALCELPVGVSELSKREIEVMTLIVAGRSNKQIANLLCRSQRTVEYHRGRLMAKLNVHNTVDLVKCAILMGLV